jgi:hypothetical protein
MPTKDKHKTKVDKAEKVVEATVEEPKPVAVKVEVEPEPVDATSSDPGEVKVISVDIQPVDTGEDQVKAQADQAIPTDSPVQTEENSEPDVPSKPESSGNNTKWLLAVIVVVLVVIIGIVLIMIAGGSEKKTVSQSIGVTSITEATATPEVTATATPTATIKRSDLKVQVLNGTNTAGLAGKAKTYLGGLGYKDVAAGNADKSDYTQTQIEIKDSKDGYLTMVKKDLTDGKYTLAEEVKSLPEDSKYDVVITLGAK